MPNPDAFTLKRFLKATRDFRQQTGQLPTQADFEKLGFAAEVVRFAIKKKLIQELYVTLTTGSIVKGYKVSSH